MWAWLLVDGQDQELVLYLGHQEATPHHSSPPTGSCQALHPHISKLPRGQQVCREPPTVQQSRRQKTVFVKEIQKGRGTHAPPTSRCWMQPLNDLDKCCNLTGRRDSHPAGSPPMKKAAGVRRWKSPGDRGRDFR